MAQTIKATIKGTQKVIKAFITDPYGEINTINSITVGEPTGSDQVENVVSLTQAEYDAGTKKATTLYIIKN
jgi:hypothetical protein